MMDDTSYKLLHLAKNVRKGKLEIVRDLLTSSGLPHSSAWSKEGHVLLREAIKYKRKDIAKLLLDYSANVNSKGRKNSNTPLHFAVLNGDIEMVQLLLDRGANINAKGRKYNSILDYKMEEGEGYTPLHLAVRAGIEEIIKLLLSRGANVNVKGKGGITSLHIAAAIMLRNGEEKYLQTVQHLLNYGAYVDSEYISSSHYWLGTTPLHFAVQLGCRETVELFLSKGANVNARTQFRLTALLIAIDKGNKELVEVLLKCGAEICGAPKPIHKAVMGGHLEIVDVLLNFGADVNYEDAYGRTALHIAIEEGHKKLVEVLLKCGAKIDYMNTPSLHVAVRWGRKEIMEVLLKFGVDIDIKDKYDRTALHIAIERGYKNLVEVLLKCGAKIDYMNTLSLHVAVRWGRKEIMEVLLKFGVDIDSKDKDDRTALYIAIENGYKEIVEVLLKCGAKIDFMNTPPLHVAATYGHTDIIEVLLKFGADINSKDKDGRTALHIAAASPRRRKGHVEALLKFGADIDSKDAHGRTPLYIAIQEGLREDIEVLLKYGAKIDFIVNDSLFHVAVTKGYTEIVEALLKFGVDIDIKDKYDRTALHIAIERGHKKLVEVLLKCGAKIDFMNTPPLHVAASNGHTDIIEVLLKFGADINLKDARGSTALHIAASAYQYESIGIVETLLKFGADSDSKDEDGRTAFHYACMRDSVCKVKTLLEHGCDINVSCKNNQTPVELALTNNNWNSAYHFKRHIIKMKTANLYLNEKNLLSINSDDEVEYKGFQNKCEEEIASMKSEEVNNGNVSFYDILTEKDVKQLAVYVENDSIAHVLRSNDYKIKFPIYASMIRSNFRKGEKRRKFLEQRNKIFYIFYINFGLPQECTEEIFSYLSDTDFKNFI